jgi:hypothetical protein
VADGIYAAEYGMEATRFEAVADGSGTEADRHQLDTGDDPVLDLGESSHHLVR